MKGERYEGYMVLMIEGVGRIYEMSGTLEECVKLVEDKKRENNNVGKVVLWRVSK